VYKGVILLALGVSIAVGLLAGLYPAFYTTSFAPALVLKGSFGMSPKGRKLRTALIGFQFVVSLGLIVAAVFLQLQNRFMWKMDTGINRENIAIVVLNRELAKEEIKIPLVSELKSDANIEDVAFAMSSMGTSDFFMSWGRNTREGQHIDFECFPVSWNFVRVMGLKVVEGRDFIEEDQTRDGVFIFNQTAMNRFGMTLDDQVEGHNGDMVPIAGVMKDFNYASLRNNIGPMCLYEFGKNTWGDLSVAFIKIKGNPFAAADHIKKTLARFDPLYPVDLTFYDTAFDNLYRKERKTTSLITVFSLLAVIISLVGVFGLVVFETQYRRKEIGVRKVLGATVAEILGMFNKSFVRLVLVCFVVAAPLAWYGVTKWLETFAYRTPVYWWVFALSLLVVLLITLITVTVQSWRAATANPVSALKTE
ncbi:MAG: FtsX-like permease family protein, partial [Rikenellaceae bacterium]|nr:FtsX-like permease family protein [Rikenellaceae bacterium]